MFFNHRKDAGQKLALELKQYRHKPNIIVVALARGGVPVGVEIAKELQCPLDVLVVRKIGFPGNSEFAMGAISLNNTQNLDQQLIQRHEIPQTVVNDILESEKLELHRRTCLYRQADQHYDFKNKTVILVDDGIATGSTARVAITVCRSAHAKQIILAVPVAAQATLSLLSAQVDKISCLHSPNDLGSVGQFYAQFNQVTDQEVLAALKIIKK